MRKHAAVGAVIVALVILGAVNDCVERRERRDFNARPDVVERKRLIAEYEDLHRDWRERSFGEGVLYYAELRSAAEAYATRHMGTRGQRPR